MKRLLLVGAILAAALTWLLWPRPASPPRPQPTAEELLARGPSACEQISFEGSRFTACRYRRGEHRIALFLDPGGQPLRSLAALERHLGPQADNLRFGMNAGMYDGGGRPIGLYIEDGNERRALNTRDGPGNFHLKPNGVFHVDVSGHVAITVSEDYAPYPPSTRWATQSGPMLVIDGALHPRFSVNGASLHVRNGVGVADADTAWFAISDDRSRSAASRASSATASAAAMRCSSTAPSPVFGTAPPREWTATRRWGRWLRCSTQTGERCTSLRPQPANPSLSETPRAAAFPHRTESPAPCFRAGPQR